MTVIAFNEEHNYNTTTLKFNHMKTPTIFINEADDYFGNLESIENAFQIKLSSNEHILFSEYVNGDNGSGHAWIILEENGILYEVHGFQSSVSDMSEDWNKEETSWQEIFYRIHHGGHEDFHTDIIKQHFSHYITEKDLIQVSDIRKNEIQKMDNPKLNKFLIKMIKNNEMSSLLYILSLPDIENKLNLNTPHDLFYHAIVYGNIPVMKILLNSETIKKYTDIYSVENMFKTLTHYKHNDLINYLIFEYKIDMTKVGHVPDSIEKLILNDKLNNQLTNENNNPPKMKV